MTYDALYVAFSRPEKVFNTYATNIAQRVASKLVIRCIRIGLNFRTRDRVTFQSSADRTPSFYFVLCVA